MKLTFRWLIILSLFIVPCAVFGQGGSGDLPPVPKTITKPKPKPTPKPKTPVKTAVTKEPVKVDVLAFDQTLEGKIDASSAGRMPPNLYYQEYRFQATEADLFRVELNSGNPAFQANLQVSLEDKNKNAIPVTRDSKTGSLLLATADATLPEDGEYRLKISLPLNAAPTTPIPFTVRLHHTGLTATGYQERLQQIIKAFNLPGERKVDEAIGQLERLARDDAQKPGAYEYLGVLYNEYKQDVPKASAAMLQAMKLGGTANFKITHDIRWRRPVQDKKLRRMVWQEQRTNWLQISSKQLVIAEFAAPEKVVVAISGNQVKNVEHIGASPFMAIKHDNKLLKQDTLGIAFNTPAEAAMADDLIKGNLLRKEQ